MSASEFSGSTPKDPVCGREVNPRSSFRATCKGRIYVFCSRHCLAKFQENPGKFIAAPAELFKCPKHPWVRQAEPGTCPQCGEFLAEVRTKWICPYHPLVQHDEPGECPIYGMTLIPEPPGRFYHCDFHPEVKQLEPGKCPRCLMILRPAWAEVCHLHCEELGPMTRDCPSCGMKLEPRKVPKQKAKDYEGVWVCPKCILVFTHD
jgi:YHS domain-containing protein